MPAPTLTSADFRRALGAFATGVTVVTAEREAGQVHGMTANSFTSVSLDPFLILVCVDHRARLLKYLKEKGRFGVSVLRETQQAWSEYFARLDTSPETEERLGIRFLWTPSGIPLVEDTLLQLACTVAAFHTAGDHTIVVGEVECAYMDSGKPLLFYRGAYRSFDSVE